MTALFESVFGKTPAKICGYAGIPGVDLYRGYQTFVCSLLDPVLQLFGNCDF